MDCHKSFIVFFGQRYQICCWSVVMIALSWVNMIPFIWTKRTYFTSSTRIFMIFDFLNGLFQSDTKSIQCNHNLIYYLHNCTKWLKYRWKMTYMMDRYLWDLCIFDNLWLVRLHESTKTPIKDSAWNNEKTVFYDSQSETLQQYCLYYLNTLLLFIKYLHGWLQS